MGEIKNQSKSMDVQVLTRGLPLLFNLFVHDCVNRRIPRCAYSENEWYICAECLRTHVLRW